MLQYAIDYVKESKKYRKIFLSTDDKSIYDYGISKGIKVIERPTSLGGETPLLDVYRHALTSLQLNDITIVVGIQPDHPDENISLDESLDKFQHDALDVLFSKDGSGEKNGAHCVMSAKGVLSGHFNKKGYIEDNCTNVHYLNDLQKAAKNIKNINRKHLNRLKNVKSIYYI